MAEPSKKSQAMEDMLEKVFGRSTAIHSDKCAFCGKEAKVFRDELSKREYTISGLCQECQDTVFGK